MTPEERKQHPVATGVMAYFPDALMEVAYCSYVGNEQHNPGEPLHWAREKSTDHPDACARHLTERMGGKVFDTDGVRLWAKVIWRASAALQLEIEAARKGAGVSNYVPHSADNPASYHPPMGDGWIPFHATAENKPPVPPFTKVFVRFQNGHEEDDPSQAVDWTWEDLHSSGTIVAYKLA